MGTSCIWRKIFARSRWHSAAASMNESRVTGPAVAWVGTSHDCEEQYSVGDGARHGADHAVPGEGACARGEMTCCRNAAGSWLESADAAEVRRCTNGAAAVAADAACGTAGSD